MLVKFAEKVLRPAHLSSADMALLGSDDSSEDSDDGVVASLDLGAGCASRPGTHDSRGSYSRSGTAKRAPHSVYAYHHWQRITEGHFGNPCGEDCPFGKNCGRNFTPSTLLRAHETSYGAATRREDKGNYSCEFRTKQTVAAWRSLFAMWVVKPADGGPCSESWSVQGVGPVCWRFAEAAYDIRQWHALRAAARGDLLAAQDLKLAGVDDALVDVVAAPTSASKEECINWWKDWLYMEDQMMDDPIIVHRPVIWTSVHEEEYLFDIAFWGTAPALSIARWRALRQDGLVLLAIEWYGYETSPGGEMIPRVMLKLQAKAPHGNFADCLKCNKNKERWVLFRHRPKNQRGSLEEARELKKEIHVHAMEVKEVRHPRTLAPAHRRTLHLASRTSLHTLHPSPLTPHPAPINHQPPIYPPDAPPPFCRSGAWLSPWLRSVLGGTTGFSTSTINVGHRTCSSLGHGAGANHRVMQGDGSIAGPFMRTFSRDTYSDSAWSHLA